MKMTKIKLIGLSAIDLPIVGALPSDNYILKSAEGLGPPEIDVLISDTINAGGYYQGRRPHNRELVFMVGINPDYKIGQTAADLRTTFYGLLTPGYSSSVLVEIIDGANTVATITGYVKKLEINPFSKDPEVQITIACLQPYFQDKNLLYIVPTVATDVRITNLGTAPAGFHMELIFTANVTNWKIENAAGVLGPGQKMDFVYNFLIGDKLTIDTRPGFRGVWLTRGGLTTNIIYTLSSSSIWYMLHGGVNIFTASSLAFTWGDVYYLPQYWGI